jgi:hypothetical protein
MDRHVQLDDCLDGREVDQNAEPQADRCHPGPSFAPVAIYVGESSKSPAECANV